MFEEYYYYDQQSGTFKKCNEHDKLAEAVMIKKKDYMLLKNSRRIQKDRSLQIADKKITDEHGYATLQLNHHEENGHTVYEITKLTPHLSKIPIDSAYEIIKQDLIDFYQYIELPTLRANNKSFDVSIENLYKYRTSHSREKFWDDYSKNKNINEELVITVQWLDETLDYYEYSRNIFAYEIKEIHTQMPQGQYIVTYKSTGIL